MCFVRPTPRPEWKRPFHIDGSGTARPPSRATIYCDGGIDDRFRPGVDLHLSHWFPNETPDTFKADTSTEICLRFVASGEHPFDVVVNNHADVDGVLAVFVLVAGTWALPHERTLAQAAAMGDFWGWGEPPAQSLYQALTLLMEELRTAGVDPGALYLRCFDCVVDFLSGERRFDADPGLAALRASVARVERGEISRTLLGDRLVAYGVPRRLYGDDLPLALRAPGFNAPLSADPLLSPRARARLDRERVHLVSVEADRGYYHDLWYPGYVWADTPRSWRPPGLVALGDSNTYVLQHPPLEEVVSELDGLERAPGRWTLARRLTPFSGIEGRGFPIVLSFMANGRQAPSSLTPERVGASVVRAFG